MKTSRKVNATSYRPGNGKWSTDCKKKTSDRERNRRIQVLKTFCGFTNRAIATHYGLTRGRVDQILRAPNREKLYIVDFDTLQKSLSGASSLMGAP